MTIVIDASVAVRWLFRLNPPLAADDLFRPGEALIAPDLLLAEITNAAWKMVIFEKFSAGSVVSVLNEAARILNEIVPSAPLAERAFAIAVELRHPAYDCFYLALAEQRDCQMVTADTRLLSRCDKTLFAKRVRPLAAA
jgi:predicted nucleic acid-binding protein